MITLKMPVTRIPVRLPFMSTGRHVATVVRRGGYRRGIVQTVPTSDALLGRTLMLPQVAASVVDPWPGAPLPGDCTCHPRRPL